MPLSDTISRGLHQLTDRGVLTTDTDLTIITWNEWLATHTGLAGEQVLGQKLFDVFPELLARNLNAAYRGALDGQVIVLAQRLHAYLLQMPPGGDLHQTPLMQQSAKIAPLVEDGRVVGTITVIEDVTERVARENELAVRARQQSAIAALSQQALSGCELRELTAAATQSLAAALAVEQCALWEFTPQRGEAVLLAGHGWNPEALGTIVPVAALERPAPFSGLPLFADHQIATGASAAVPTGQGRFGCLTVYSRTPRTFSEDEFQLLQTVAHVIGMAVDRKHMETELRRRADALAEADRRKDEFLAMLAHELRNPLAPILHAVQMLGLPAASADDRLFAHGVVRGQVEQMARLVDDLLDVSRITRGQINLRMEPMRLADVVTQAVESSRPLIESHGHTLELSLTAEPLQVRGDELRLVQVVTNLLNNAAKYTENGGRIRLTLARDGGEAVVSVRDNGVGISPEMMPRVFDLFTQATRSLARSQGGLGIGLTLVRRLVELHEGRVEAHSSGLGQGSEFLMRLPLIAGATAPSHRADTAGAVGAVGAVGAAGAPAQAGVKGLRVLVVDDNADAADSLAMLLKASGHQPLVAYDGHAALDCASQHELDVVFLDIGLPGMDGYEVARRLRQQHGDGPCLVALTGYGQPDDRETGRRAGFNHHLVKPISFARVQQALTELCAEK